MDAKRKSYTPEFKLKGVMEAEPDRRDDTRTGAPGNEQGNSTTSRLLEEKRRLAKREGRIRKFLAYYCIM